MSEMLRKRNRQRLTRVSGWVVSFISDRFQQTPRQPRLVASPAYGQLNKENVFSLPPLTPEILSRDLGLGLPYGVSPLILHTQDESGTSGPYSSLPLLAAVSIRIVMRHGVSPEFIRSPVCTDGVHVGESPDTGPVELKVVL